MWLFGVWPVTRQNRGMYTTTQAARLADISVSSVYNYAKEYHAYLSPGATPAPGETRQFDEVDIGVLVTIATMRRAGFDTDAIIAALDEGQRMEPVAPPKREAEAPPAPATTDLVPMEAYQTLARRLEAESRRHDDALEREREAIERAIKAESAAEYAERKRREDAEEAERRRAELEAALQAEREKSRWRKLKEALIGR